MGSVRSKIHATIGSNRRKTFDNPRSVREFRRKSGSLQTTLDIFENPATLRHTHTPPPDVRGSSSFEGHDASATSAAVPVEYPPDEVKRLVDADLGPSVVTTANMGANLSKLKKRADSGIARPSLPRNAQGYVNYPETSSRESMVEVEICSKLPLSDLRAPCEQDSHHALASDFATETKSALETKLANDPEPAPEPKPAPPRTEAARPGGLGANREDRKDSVYICGPTGEAVPMLQSEVEAIDPTMPYRMVSDFEAERQAFRARMLAQQRAGSVVRLRAFPSHAIASTSVISKSPAAATGSGTFNDFEQWHNDLIACRDEIAQQPHPDATSALVLDAMEQSPKSRQYSSATRSNGLGGFTTDSGYASKQASDTPIVSSKPDVAEPNLPDVQISESAVGIIKNASNTVPAAQDHPSKSFETTKRKRGSQSSTVGSDSHPRISPPMNPTAISEAHGTKLYGLSNQAQDDTIQPSVSPAPAREAALKRDDGIARESLDRLRNHGTSSLYGRSSAEGVRPISATMTTYETVNNQIQAVKWHPNEMMLVPTQLEAEWRRCKHTYESKLPRAVAPAAVVASSSRSAASDDVAAANQAMLEVLGTARANELRARATARVAEANAADDLAATAQDCADAATPKAKAESRAEEEIKGERRAGNAAGQSGVEFEWTDEERKEMKRAMRYADGSLD